MNYDYELPYAIISRNSEPGPRGFSYNNYEAEVPTTFMTDRQQSVVQANSVQTDAELSPVMEATIGPLSSNSNSD